MINGKFSPSPKEDIYKILFESPSYNNMRTAFDKFLSRPVWWCAEKKAIASIKPLTPTQRAKDMQDHLSISDYKKVIMQGIAKAARLKAPFVFKYDVNYTYGIAVPILKDQKPVGFYGLCGLKSKPSDSLCQVLFSYTNAVLGEINKEIELSKVYDIVRPRAIALSTVHTVHRLISSTLDIKELFPRIARLSLQVLRAECADICMIDKNTKKLACAAAVDYRKTKDIFKLKTRPSLIEEKVFETGISVYKNNLLCVPLVDEEICGVILIREKIGTDKFSIFDREILTTLAEQAVIAIRNAQMYKEQEDLTIGIIKSLSYLLDAKFPRLYTHTEFFIELMPELGREMGLMPKELKILHYAAILPDLGKLVVPEEILQKKKALNGKERDIIKTHTIRGIEVLKYLDVLKPVVPIILHHHEWFNGTGYPSGLKGKDIPLGARIMAVADAFEAMLCHRPYRRPIVFKSAVAEIKRQAEKQFDPDAVKAFMNLADNGKLEELAKRHAGEFKKTFETS